MAIYQKAEHLYALQIFSSIEELELQMTTASVSRWHFAPQDPASRKLHAFDRSKECFVPHPFIFQLMNFCIHQYFAKPNNRKLFVAMKIAGLGGSLNGREIVT